MDTINIHVHVNSMKHGNKYIIEISISFSLLVIKDRCTRSAIVLEHFYSLGCIIQR